MSQIYAVLSRINCCQKIYALLSIKFLDLKMCQCKKMTNMPIRPYKFERLKPLYDDLKQITFTGLQPSLLSNKVSKSVKKLSQQKC